MTDIRRLLEGYLIKEFVLEKRRWIFGDEHLDMILAICNLVATLGEQGQLEEMMNMEKEVREKRRRILGEEHPDTISAMNNLASTLGEQGQLDEAAKMKKECYLGQLLDRLPTTTTSPVCVLELGCGYGLPVTQKLLSHANFSVTANDLSSAQLALARASLLPDPPDPPGPAHDRLTLLESDMLALDFAPTTFDAVVDMYSIIHLPRAEQVEMLRKIVGVAEAGRMGAGELCSRGVGGKGGAELARGRERMDVLEWLGERRHGGEGVGGGTGSGCAGDCGRCG
jgi:SAM-dependent methyltransferase